MIPTCCGDVVGGSFNGELSPLYSLWKSIFARQALVIMQLLTNDYRDSKDTHLNKQNNNDIIIDGHRLESE